jgi:Ni/Fe-hydrogenase subunit HybB-like protein
VLGNVVAAAYFPSLTEVAVSIGILGYALLGLTLGIRHLPIYPKYDQPTEDPAKT